jgi:hypothetical protein
MAPTDLARAPKAGWHINGSAISQRHYRANAGNRHQAPADIIVPRDGQQAAVQDADLLAKHPSDNEQRFDQHGQIRETFDELFDARFKFDRRLGKNFLTLLQHWSGAVMCPGCLCGGEAAGHNALRGSGPNRKRAL